MYVFSIYCDFVREKNVGEGLSKRCEKVDKMLTKTPN